MESAVQSPTLGVRHAHSVSEPHNVGLFGSPVGEVKGWFANLFNWKAQQYVLHSVDNTITTRDEAARILQSLGCHVILEETQGWGVLRCRMEEVFGMFSFLYFPRHVQSSLIRLSRRL